MDHNGIPDEDASTDSDVISENFAGDEVDIDYSEPTAQSVAAKLAKIKPVKVKKTTPLKKVAAKKKTAHVKPPATDKKKKPANALLAKLGIKSLYALN